MQRLLKFIFRQIKVLGMIICWQRKTTRGRSKLFSKVFFALVDENRRNKTIDHFFKSSVIGISPLPQTIEKHQS